MTTPFENIRKPYTLKRVWFSWETFYYLLFDGDRVGVLGRKDGKYICDLLNSAYRVGWHESELHRVSPTISPEDSPFLKPWVCDWCSTIVPHSQYHDCKEGKQP